MLSILRTSSQQTEETVENETEHGESGKPFPVKSGKAGDILLFHGNLLAVIIGGNGRWQRSGPWGICTEKGPNSLRHGIISVRFNGGEGKLRDSGDSKYLWGLSGGNGRRWGIVNAGRDLLETGNGGGGIRDRIHRERV